MEIYVKKITNHDLTHQFSILTKVQQQFFEVRDNGVIVEMIDEDGNEYSVNVFTTTDPRLGGDIKTFLNNNNININDYVIIKKTKNKKFIISALHENDDRSNFLNDIYSKNNDSHLLIYDDVNSNGNNNTDDDNAHGYKVIKFPNSLQYENLRFKWL